LNCEDTAGVFDSQILFDRPVPVRVERRCSRASIELLGLKLIFLLFTSDPSIESEKCPEVLDPGDERGLGRWIGEITLCF